MMSDRALFVASAILGFTAVSCGAFGAHALRGFFAGLEDGANRAAWWSTAVEYHLAHALAVGLAAAVVSRTESSAASFSGMAFIGGVILFSGSLYTMSLTGHRFLGAVTPIGGLGLLVGWASLGVAALSFSR